MCGVDGMPFDTLIARRWLIWVKPCQRFYAILQPLTEEA